ncbi:hypothetical protein ACQ4WX_46090 [Streptomyces lasalocidi]
MTVTCGPLSGFELLAEFEATGSAVVLDHPGMAFEGPWLSSPMS